MPLVNPGRRLCAITLKSGNLPFASVRMQLNAGIKSRGIDCTEKSLFVVVIFYICHDEKKAFCFDDSCVRTITERRRR